MKKSRNVEYTVCDECEKESIYMVYCSKCNKELCRNCITTSPIGSHYFCKDCYNDSIKKAYNKFTEDWTKLKAKQDKESDTMIDEFNSFLEDIVGE